MVKVGLTGGLASGKTFVAGVFERLGCRVAYADRMGHETLEPGGEAYHDVIRTFGPSIVAENGSIDRKKLGAIVFAQNSRLDELNALIHPHVFRRQEAFFAEVERADSKAVAVVEAAIMIETGSYKRYDKLVLAACPPEVQIRRYMHREGASEAQARARLDRQMPLDEKRKYADYVIDTSGTKVDTERQVRDVYAILKELAS
jgi:dephospho-CoA kinase